jgi:hypothetical protein
MSADSRMQQFYSAEGLRKRSDDDVSVTPIPVNNSSSGAAVFQANSTASLNANSTGGFFGTIKDTAVSPRRHRKHHDFNEDASDDNQVQRFAVSGGSHGDGQHHHPLAFNEAVQVGDHEHDQFDNEEGRFFSDDEAASDGGGFGQSGNSLDSIGADGRHHQQHRNHATETLDAEPGSFLDMPSTATLDAEPVTHAHHRGERGANHFDNDAETSATAPGGLIATPLGTTATLVATPLGTTDTFVATPPGTMLAETLPNGGQQDASSDNAPQELAGDGMSSGVPAYVRHSSFPFLLWLITASSIRCDSSCFTFTLPMIFSRNQFFRFNLFSDEFCLLKVEQFACRVRICYDRSNMTF